MAAPPTPGGPLLAPPNDRLWLTQRLKSLGTKGQLTENTPERASALQRVVGDDVQKSECRRNWLCYLQTLSRVCLGNLRQCDNDNYYYFRQFDPIRLLMTKN
jgi:hypothetical protein